MGIFLQFTIHNFVSIPPACTPVAHCAGVQNRFPTNYSPCLTSSQVLQGLLEAGAGAAQEATTRPAVMLPETLNYLLYAKCRCV